MGMNGRRVRKLFVYFECLCCVLRVLCFALGKIQRKGGRVVKGANRMILVRDYFFLVERSINNLEDDL